MPASACKKVHLTRLWIAVDELLHHVLWLLLLACQRRQLPWHGTLYVWQSCLGISGSAIVSAHVTIDDVSGNCRSYDHRSVPAIHPTLPTHSTPVLLLRLHIATLRPATHISLHQHEPLIRCKEHRAQAHAQQRHLQCRLHPLGNTFPILTRSGRHTHRKSRRQARQAQC